jgi:mannosyltransferase OCH1-like enzyme
VESRLVTTRQLRDWRRFREENGDLDFHILTAPERDAYMEESWGGSELHQLYLSAALGVVKADIFRYAIVFDRGGYYCDANKGVFSKLSSYTDSQQTGLVSFESNDALVFPSAVSLHEIMRPHKLVLQWAFGFAPKHRLLERVISRIEENGHLFQGQIFEVPKNAVLQFSSAGMFTQVFREYAEEVGLAEISQIDVDFEKTGVFRLDGVRVVEKHFGHYSELRDSKILA